MILTLINNYSLRSYCSLIPDYKYTHKQTHAPSCSQQTPTSSLHCFLKSGVAVARIIIFPPMTSPKQSVPEELFRSFISSIKGGNIEAVEQILKKCPSDIVNQLDPESQQPALFHAVIADGDDKSEQLIKLLIRHGANIRFKDSVEQTILFYVCRQGKQKCAEVLLSQGMSLDEPDRYGQTPLFYAANENRLEIIRKYATKERVNHNDKLAAQTPLYYAARKGHLEMTKLLVEKGAEVHHTDSSNKTPADIARKAKQSDVADFLVTELRRYRQTNKLSMASQSIEQSNLERRKKREQVQKPIRQTYKIVCLNEKGDPHDLTEEEVRQIIRSRPELEGYLANPQSIPQELIDRGNADSWEKVAIKILAQCMKLKGSYWFQEAVDPVKFNIMDYFDIITKPMDLGTVRKKLTHNCYGSSMQFIDDMNLIWKNCYKYNGQGHDISKCAKELEVNFNEYYRTYGLDKYLTNDS